MVAVNSKACKKSVGKEDQGGGPHMEVLGAVASLLMVVLLGCVF